ncbi:Acetyl esterase [Candidatus Lokiarchaeum ossiferum]|uniref:Acetyl esterase n=1 Tax=Candidatus Lokiarchaeum ossiferum TaxID=2951803 RepID=A0ABY6HU15_9ARCH|nr:Acetyl esterase [Candidatus Lokiarchaeum sp. B-35]
MKIPLYTSDLTSHDVDMPSIMKFILRSITPKVKDDPKKMRELDNKMATSLMARFMYGKKIPLWKVEDRNIPATHPNLNIRVYIPTEKTNLPAIIFFHGGGYVIGSVKVFDRLCRKMARDLEAIIISVDYRLAPEYKYPDAPNDGWTAVQWVFAQYKKFHINLSQIYVMGESAGGGISAVMTYKSRDDENISLAGQIMVCPWLDGNFDAYPSMRKFENGYILSYSLMEFFRDAYKNNDDELNDIDFSPVLLEDCTNLPPTFLITASHDPLRDQGYAFAQKLHTAGNQLIFKNYQPTAHGFLSAHNSLPMGKEMYADVISTIKIMMDQAE